MIAEFGHKEVFAGLIAGLLCRWSHEIAGVHIGQAVLTLKGTVCRRHCLSDIFGDTFSLSRGLLFDDPIKPEKEAASASRPDPISF